MVDDDRFDEFYDRTLPVIYGYFLRRCGGRRDVAEELTQETYLSALRSFDRGVSVDADGPWVVSIARRRLVDYYRREARRRKRESTIRFEERVAAGTGSLTTLAEARMIAALDRVPRSQRLALILRHVDGLAIGEVADLMGRTVSATDSLLRRGRSSLQEAYEEVDID